MRIIILITQCGETENTKPTRSTMLQLDNRNVRIKGRPMPILLQKEHVINQHEDGITITNTKFDHFDYRFRVRDFYSGFQHNNIAMCMQHMLMQIGIFLSMTEDSFVSVLHLEAIGSLLFVRPIQNTCNA